MNYELIKNVKVSDSNNWYGETNIKVKMFPLLYPCKRAVRIMFCSIDDFRIYRDVETWSFEANWNWCKKYLWDNIPEVVSADWMYKHGYLPF